MMMLKLPGHGSQSGERQVYPARNHQCREKFSTGHHKPLQRDRATKQGSPMTIFDFMDRNPWWTLIFLLVISEGLVATVKQLRKPKKKR
ncbi:hypothetical protein N8V28_21515 [Enterobacter hormaechei subsp. hoffmannii]|nr:hypothetical protein [Enterobacter hormaechei subsp. hoffmannii]